MAPDTEVVAWAALADTEGWFALVDQAWLSVQEERTVLQDGLRFTFRIPAGATALALSGTGLRIDLSAPDFSPGTTEASELVTRDPSAALKLIEQVSPRSAAERAHQKRIRARAYFRLGRDSTPLLEEALAEARASSLEQLADQASAALSFHWIQARDFHRVDLLLGSWLPSPSGHMHRASSHARLEFALGNFAASYELAVQSMEEAERLDVGHLKVDSAVMAAQSLAELGQPMAGAKLVESECGELRDLPPCLAYSVALNLAWLWTEAEAPAPAQEALRMAEAQATDCPRGASPGLLLNAVSLNLVRGDLAAAQSALNSVTRHPDVSKPAWREYLLEARASVARASGRVDEARAAFSQLAEWGRATARPDLIGLALIGRASSHDEDDIDAALRDLRTATRLLARWSTSLPAVGLRGPAISRRRSGHRELIRLALDQGQPKLAFETLLHFQRLVYPPLTGSNRPELRRDRAALASARAQLESLLQEDWRAPGGMAHPRRAELRREIEDLERRLALPPPHASRLHSGQPKDAVVGAFVPDEDEVVFLWRHRGRVSAERWATTATSALGRLVAEVMPERSIPLALIPNEGGQHQALHRAPTRDGPLGARHPVLISLRGSPPTAVVVPADGYFSIDPAGRHRPLRLRQDRVGERLSQLGWRRMRDGSFQAVLQQIGTGRAFLFAGHAGAARPDAPATLEFGYGSFPTRALLALGSAPTLVQLFACSTGATGDIEEILDGSWAPALIAVGAQAVLASRSDITAEAGAEILQAWSGALDPGKDVTQVWADLNGRDLPGLEHMNLLMP